MQLTTGKMPFKIEFDNGDVETIYINPNDRGLMERLRNFEGKAQERAKKIDGEKYSKMINHSAPEVDLNDIDALLNLAPEQIDALCDNLDVLGKVEDEYNAAIRDELDAVFQSPVSKSVFKYCQPFDMMEHIDRKGNVTREPYVMQFIRGLADEMRNQAMANQAAVQKHIAKYNK